MRVKIVQDMFDEGILGLKVRVHSVGQEGIQKVWFVDPKEFANQGVALEQKPELVGFYSFEVKEVVTCNIKTAY